MPDKGLIVISHMTPEQFEKLLYEEESPTLDFKEAQYPFAKASEEDKSELLKDILGFANAWRRSEAFILIGVREVRGGRSEVVGIDHSHHLADHSLQQFVNNLTNRPIRFHYEAFSFEGKQIGIVRIELQRRPVYLKSDYDKLRRNDVYVRRGTSTDPSKPATNDEIALMGSDITPDAAELTVEFADAQRDDSLGSRIELQLESCKMPDKIPSLKPPRVALPYAMDFEIPDMMLNREFFRDLAAFEFAKRFFRPIRVVIANVGSAAASDVHCELVLAVDGHSFLVERADMPHAPSSRDRFGASGFMNIKPVVRDAGDVNISQNAQRFRVDIGCNDLQPKRQVWSETFYFGTHETGEVVLAGRLFAANLPEPKSFELTIGATVKQSSMSVKELCSLPEPKANAF